jgi:hypothetical protein
MAGGKVSAIEALLRKLLPEDRERLTAILNEEPNLEAVLAPKGADYLAKTGHKPIGEMGLNPTPVALMEPQQFRDLALPIRELDYPGRAAGIAKLIKDEGLRSIPDLGVDFSQDSDLLGVMWHDGRGRSAALESLGLRKIPVTMTVAPSHDLGFKTLSEKIDWLMRNSKLIPEVDESDFSRGRDPVDISDVKLFAKGGKVINFGDEYAEGGKVSDKKKDRPHKNRLELLSLLLSLPNPMMPAAAARDKQLFGRGFLSQWYGLNDEGDPQFLGGESLKNWPGIVDEVIAMPTLLPDRFVPDASNRAAERLEKLNAAIHEDMKLKPASGFRENLIDAAGTMAGQIPTGGAKAVEGAAAKAAPGLLRKAGNVVKTAGEWFTPTVEATPSNYLIGTLTGGGLNSLAEEVPDRGVNAVSKYATGGGVSGDLARMKGRYASGGKASSALKAINEAISAIEAGDQSSAVELLKPHKGNAAVAEVLKNLGKPAEEG